MTKKLSIILGASLSLGLFGCLAGTPKTKTVKAESQNLQTDVLTISSFRPSGSQASSNGYYAYLADGSNAYARYGAVAVVSGYSFGLTGGPTESPYNYEDCYNFASINSYGALTSLTLDFASGSVIPEGAELVCYYSAAETEFMYCNNVYYGLNTLDKLFTLDSTFADDTYTFDVPSGTTVKSFSFVVRGTNQNVLFDSLSFTWDVEPNRIVKNIDSWKINVKDGPQDSPIITTSDMDLTYNISYGDYILDYDTETKKFIPLGYGSVYVQAKSETENYTFNVIVEEDVDDVVLHSNDTKDVDLEGWEEVTDPSKLTYGDVITFYSKAAFGGVEQYVNDEECGKFELGYTYSFDTETERIYGDKFMKFMLIPSVNNSGGAFGIVSLSSTGKQLLRTASWLFDLGSIHYETRYSVLIGEPTPVPTAFGMVNANQTSWSFESTTTPDDDNMIVKDITVYNGPHLGVTTEGCIDLVNDDNNGVTVYRYVGVSSETYTVSDAQSGSSSAITFAHFFLDKMGEVCLTGTQNVKERFVKFFTTSSYSDPYSKFSFLANDSLFVLKNAVADDTGDVLQRFASLYDFVVTEYGVTDYIGRNPVSSSGSNSLTLGINSSVALVVIASSFCATIAVGALLLKKKKEN